MKDKDKKSSSHGDSQRKEETRDVSSSATRSEKIKSFFLGNNKRNLKIVVGVVCAVAALLLVIVGVYIAQKLGLITIDRGTQGDADGTFAAEEQFEAMFDVTDASDIDSLLTAWATNGGAKYSSKNVINVMLLGIDSEDGTSTGRSDAMILLSLNRRTKKITLVSFLRDCYTYMEINGQGRCCKMNHSYFWGGPATLIETLENNYKIEIDHYISVDFASFPRLIDALGGVTIPIQQYEAEYINRTTTSIAKVSSGDAVRINGAQALVYSRIRYVDSEGDVGRTARQRTIIMALIASAQNASAGQLNNAMDIVLPNVVTNYKRSEILSLLTQALSQGWMNYDIEQLVMPSQDNYTSAMLWTYYARMINRQLSVWVVDYPVVARELQLALYGDTNINIGPDHVSAVDLLRNNATPRPNYSASAQSTGVGESLPEDTSVQETESTQPDSEEYTDGESGTPGIDITLPEFTLPNLTLPWNRETTPATDDENAA